VELGYFEVKLRLFACLNSGTWDLTPGPFGGRCSKCFLTMDLPVL